MQHINLGVVDYAILLIYVGFVVGIGFALRRHLKSSSDFLTSGRSIPTWVTGLAFISANLGALELVGMAASGAKYGIATSHFYWVGAIPAMVFLAIFMMPFYYGSKARSVPEYLKMRFDERVRTLNSVAFAVMTVFASGISMNALAKLLNLLLGWNYHMALWVCSGVVLVYVLKGGLTSAIYTEVLQFFMIVLGFTPVVYLGLKDAGGWSGMTQALQGVATEPATYYLKEQGVSYGTNAWTSAWQPLVGGPQQNPMGVDLFAMVFGLGFVLSFGYWCTNFLVVQRAMAARNMTAARNTPLVAAVPKMLFPALVIVPGMIAIALTSMPGKNYRIPPPILSEAIYEKAVATVKSSATANEAGVKAVAEVMGKKMDSTKVLALIRDAGQLSDDQVKEGLYNSVAEYDYDGVIISLVKRYCPTGLLGLALTALLASFMSGMAGNVTAFNTVWTYDLYQAYIAPNKSDQHYFRMGQWVTVVGILLSIVCAYFASMYNNAMDIIQLVFGFVNAPLFATFLLGMFWARCTGTGAFLGLFGGIASSAVFHGLSIASGNVPGVKGGWLCGINVSATFLVEFAIFAAVFGAVLIHVARGEPASENRKRVRFGHALINVVAPVSAVLSIAINWRPSAPKQYPSEMAQNFWLASFAFIVCFALTVAISLATRSTKTHEELKGLVYSLTPKLKDEGAPWYQRPATVGIILLVACVILNIIFW